jgi:hypothetical protein
MAASSSSPIEPFTISIPQSQLDRLHQKLVLTDFPDDLLQNNAQAWGWSHGTPIADIKRLVQYWQHGFDWRAQERQLNLLPHFKTSVNVDGFGDVGVHFLHSDLKPTEEPKTGLSGKEIPLLFVHGCECTSFFHVAARYPIFLHLSNTSTCSCY